MILCSSPGLDATLKSLLPTSCSPVLDAVSHSLHLIHMGNLALSPSLKINLLQIPTKNVGSPKSRSNDFTTLSLCPLITVLIAVMPPYGNRFHQGPLVLSLEMCSWAHFSKHLISFISTFILLQIVFLHNSTPGLQGETRDWLKHCSRSPWTYIPSLQSYPGHDIPLYFIQCLPISSCIYLSITPIHQKGWACAS